MPLLFSLLLLLLVWNNFSHLSNAAPCVCVKFVVRNCSSSNRMRLDQPNDDDILSEKYCEGAVRYWCHRMKSTIATEAIHLIELCSVLCYVCHIDMATGVVCVVYSIDYWLLTFEFSFKYSSPIQLVLIQYVKFYSSLYLVGIVSFIEFTELLRTLFAANSIEKLENFDEIVYVFVYASWLSTLLSFTISYILFIFTLKSIHFHFQMCTSKPFESLWIFLFLVALFVADIVIFVTHISQSESDCRMKCHRQ